MTDTIVELQRILREGFDIPSEALSRDTRLESLGIDSLRTIEILFQVEDAFDIRIPSVQEQPAQNRRLLKLPREMPELAADLDVTARGSAHAPNRRTTLAAPNAELRRHARR